MARQLVVELLANTDKFKGGLNSATNQTKTFGQSVANAARIAGPALAGMGAALTALSGPLDQSNAQLEVMVQNSENVSETQIAKWAEDNRRAFQLSGISIADQNAGLSEAIGLGHDWETTARIMSVANDLSAATGISLTEAIAQIGRASDGSGKLIDRFGLDVENTDELLVALDEKIGGVSAEIDTTFTGRVKGATTIVKDWGAQIGVVAGPVLAGLGGALTVMPMVIRGVTGALGGMRTALTFISSHPLILAGTAIVAGLVLLENKFGAVSGAIRAIKDALVAVWNFFRDLPGRIASGVGDIRDAFLDMIPGGGLFGAIGAVFHQGGVVPGRPGQTVPILAQAGETITPAGRGGSSMVFNISGAVDPASTARQIRDLLAADARRGAR